MARYSKGDVVFVHYPYTENGVLKSKPRPAIVQEVANGDHLVVKCTSKNRSDKLDGIWVLKASKEGIRMGITENTFINATKTITLKEYFIIRKIGTCPFMEQIDELLDPS